MAAVKYLGHSTNWSGAQMTGRGKSPRSIRGKQTDDEKSVAGYAGAAIAEFFEGVHFVNKKPMYIMWSNEKSRFICLYPHILNVSPLIAPDLFPSYTIGSTLSGELMLISGKWYSV